MLVAEGSQRLDAPLQHHQLHRILRHLPHAHLHGVLLQLRAEVRNGHLPLLEHALALPRGGQKVLVGQQHQVCGQHLHQLGRHVSRERSDEPRPACRVSQGAGVHVLHVLENGGHGGGNVRHLGRSKKVIQRKSTHERHDALGWCRVNASRQAWLRGGAGKHTGCTSYLAWSRFPGRYQMTGADV